MLTSASPLLNLVTGSSAGTPGNGFSLALFQTDTTFYIDSDATNLVSGDTNAHRDIFFKDITTGAISRVSTTSTGAQANGDSTFLEQRADGKAILFTSTANNLFAGGSGNGSPYASSLYVKDLTTGTVTQVDTSATGVHGNGYFSYGSFITNTQVLLMSDSSNLVTGDTNKAIDIFVKDLSTGAITLVSTNSSGVEGNKDSFAFHMSADHHRVFFLSDATNMVTGDTNAKQDFFVKDLTTGAVTRLSTTSTGAQINGDSTPVWISNDETKVMFISSGTNVVTGDTNHADDIFLKNLTTGAVTVLTSNSAGQIANGASEAVAMSVDASKIVFSSVATNLVSGDTNNSADVFVKDVNTGALTRVFTNPNHRDGDNYEFQGQFVENGTKLVLQVTYHNDSDDTAALMNGGVQLTTTSIYIIDLATLSSTLIASGGNGAIIGAGGSSYTLFDNYVELSGVSPDGHHLLLSDHQGTIDLANPVMLSNDYLYTIGSGLIQRTVGNSGGNTLTGGASDDYMFGMGGTDTISGGAGNDLIDGGTNADSMTGGSGNDTYYVDNSGDKVYETSGNGTDTVYSSVSFSIGTQSIDYLVLTGTNNINATGSKYGNNITGNDGNNVIDGGAGVDKMYGGLGNDTYYVDNTGDKVYETSGNGTDTVYSSVSFSIGTQSIDYLVLTGSADINATGSKNGNNITGNDGNNVIDGGAGADKMYGGLGNDTYYVDNSGDKVYETSGNGTDTVYSSVSFSIGTQSIDYLVLTGTNNINATGSKYGNNITGNDGNNVIDGGLGGDKMYGGLGNDTYYVDNTGDKVYETSGGGTDTVYSSVSFNMGTQSLERLYLTGTANINGTGTKNGNTIVGNDGNNTLDGAAGNDTLTGGLGADTFLFNLGSGADKITDFSGAQGDSINIHAYTGGAANLALITQSGTDVKIDLGGGNIITVQHATNDAAFQSHIIW